MKIIPSCVAGFRWFYLRLQLRQVPHHLSAVRTQILQVILQALQLLPRLCLLAAPLPQVGHTSPLELRVQLHIQGPLVEDPLHLHLTVSGELQEDAGLVLIQTAQI